MSFTGRIRYRTQKRLFRDPVLVLQIEHRIRALANDGPSVTAKTYKIWTDAKVEHITEMENEVWIKVPIVTETTQS